MKQAERLPTRFTDPDGIRCARVPLSDGKHHASIEWDTYWELRERGLSGAWFLNSNGKTGRDQAAYVRASIDGSPRAVARLVADAGAGDQVHYKDRDRLNLRRSNLQVTPGGRAKHAGADLLPLGDDDGGY